MAAEVARRNRLASLLREAFSQGQLRALSLLVESLDKHCEETEPLGELRAILHKASNSR
jgi:hypothetical protein